MSEIKSRLVWDSIHTCPWDVYRLATEEDDSRHFLKEWEEEPEESLDWIFEKMTCQLLDEFGLDGKNLLIHYKEKDLLRLEFDFLATGNPTYETKIILVKRQIEKLKTDPTKETSPRRVNSRNKEALMRDGLDTSKLTVYDYHRILTEERNEPKTNPKGKRKA